MKQYQADRKEDLQLQVICMTATAVASLLFSKISIAGCIMFSVIVSIVILNNLFSTRLIVVRLDQLNKTLNLIYGNYFKEVEAKHYDYQKLEYTYKKQKTSFRGGVKNVCSIYYGDKRLAKLIPGDSGWDEGEISNLVYDLVNLGVKKKFIGYLLKDVEI